MKKFTISTPNVFKFLDGTEIKKTYKAKNKSEACDKFYIWIESKYNYSPDLVSIKEITD